VAVSRLNVNTHVVVVVAVMEASTKLVEFFYDILPWLWC